MTHLTLLTPLKNLFYSQNVAVQNDIIKLFEDKYNISKTNFLLNINNIDFRTQQIRDCIKIINNYPVEYITNKVLFYNNEFYIQQKVLIPREDTEILVNAIIKKLNKDRNYKIFEIGTGSGALLVSLALNNAKLRLCGIDIYNKAYQNTKHNINKYNLKNRVFNTKCDIKNFVKFKGLSLKNCDIIFSNPPYIKKSSHSRLQSSVKFFESHLALFGGVDGLYFYKLILNKCSIECKKNAIIFFEIGYDISKELTNFINKKYFGMFKITEKIYHNNINRVIVIQKIL